MPHAIRSLAVLVCALATSCGSSPYYRMEWSLTEAVTLVPGESFALPITARREAPHHGEVRITLENTPAGVVLTPAEFSIPEGQDSVTTTPTLAVAADTSAPLQTVNEFLLVARDPSNNVTSGARFFLAVLAPPAPQPDFSLTVEPRQVDLFAGQSRQVTVTVTRTAGFTGPLTLTLDSSNTRLRADPLTLNGDQTSGTLRVSVDSRLTRLPVTARIVATAEDSRRATTGFTFNIQ